MTDKSEIYRASDAADQLDCAVLESSGSGARSSKKLKNPATDLLETIESEILPRLVLVHSSGSSSIMPPTNGNRVRPEELDDFVGAMIDQSGMSGREMVDEFIRDGLTPEAVYLDLLAPAARQMGELWEHDIRNFTDVTIGLCRLHEVLRHCALTPSYQQVSSSPEAPSILLSTACGDQHVFGIIMVAEFFRKEGWQVTCEPGASTDELLRIASLQSFDVIGLSIARSLESELVSEVIDHLRRESLNPATKIIVGGALIERDPSFALKVGADSSLIDPATAPAQATNLLADARLGC